MNPPLPERLTKALLIELASGDYQEGERFLSRRKIMRRWQVSCLTTTRSLRILAERRLIGISKRSGHYLRRGFRRQAMVWLSSSTITPLPAIPAWENKARTITQGAEPLKRIAVIVLFEEPTRPEKQRSGSPPHVSKKHKIEAAGEFESRMAHLFRKTSPGTCIFSAKSIYAAASKSNVTVDFYHHDGQPQSMDHILNSVKSTMAQGVIILKRILSLGLRRLADPLLQIGIPVVSVFDDCQGPQITSVNFNNVAMGYSAAKVLINEGHKRIGVLLPPEEEKPCYFRDRFHGCQLAAEEVHGRKIQIDPLTINGPEDFWESKYLRTFDRRDLDRVTGIFATSVPLVTYLRPVLCKNNIRIPKDLSVIVCSSSPRIPPFTKPFDILKVDFERIGLEAFQVLQSLHRGAFTEKTCLIDAVYEPHGTVVNLLDPATRGVVPSVLPQVTDKPNERNDFPNRVDRRSRPEKFKNY